MSWPQLSRPQNISLFHQKKKKTLAFNTCTDVLILQAWTTVLFFRCQPWTVGLGSKVLGCSHFSLHIKM